MSIDKSKLKKVLTNILDHSRKEEVLIWTLKTKILIIATIKVNIAMIDANAYCTASLGNCI